MAVVCQGRAGLAPGAGSPIRVSHVVAGAQGVGRQRLTSKELDMK